jgi:hypothetical protein
MWILSTHCTCTSAGPQLLYLYCKYRTSIQPWFDAAGNLFPFLRLACCYYPEQVAPNIYRYIAKSRPVAGAAFINICC